MLLISYSAPLELIKMKISSHQDNEKSNVFYSLAKNVPLVDFHKLGEGNIMGQN